jgi:hypothetical protein
VDIVQGKLNTNTANLADLVGLMNQLNALDGKTATGNLGAGFAFAMPTGSFALSIHAHSYTDFSARTLVDPADTDPTSGRIITALISGNVQNLGSEARILAANVLELGVSVARQFDIAGMSLSIGATPKVQRVDTFNYAINAQNFENLDDFNDAAFRTDEIDFNLDLGVAFSPVEALTIGLVGRNVLAQDYGTVNTFGQAFTYEIQPKLILGAAVKLETLTLAADIDVTGDDRFKDVTLNFSNVLDDDSQFARFGAEFDAWTWAQIRAGYVTDLENTVEDMFTAGIGISPGDVWHLDIAGMYADEHSFGGVVQMSFTF